MSSKPTDLPVWATDTNYPAGAEAWSATPIKVEPLSGDQAAGWTPRQKPPAQTLNWWQNLVYLWTAFLDTQWDTDGNLTLDTDAGIILSGDGEIYHDTKTLVIPAIAGSTGDHVQAFTASGATGAVSFSAGVQWFIPIILPVGKRITEIRMRTDCDDGSAVTMELYIKRLGGPIDPGDDDDDGTSVESDPITGANQDTAMTGLNTTITEGGYTYHLYFEQVTGTGDCTIGAIEIDYDQLPPP